MSNVIFLINLPVCTLIAGGGGGGWGALVSLLEHVPCTSFMSNVHVHPSCQMSMYILHVKCHLPYKSACVYFDSQGWGALVSLLEHVPCTSFMSNVIFLINLPVCTLIATGGGGVFKTYTQSYTWSSKEKEMTYS